MCFKNGKFQKVYRRNQGGPGYAHIAKKKIIFKVSPKGLIMTNQLENLCAMLKNSLNQVSKLVKIPVFPYFIYQKVCYVVAGRFPKVRAKITFQSMADGVVGSKPIFTGKVVFRVS